MLDFYFTSPYVLRGMRAGPAGPTIDKMAGELRAAGLGREGSQRALRGAWHFVDWACSGGVDVAALDKGWLVRFEHHLVDCMCPRGRRDRVDAQLRGARMVLEHVAGRLSTRLVSKVTVPPSRLVEEFDVWARDQRGLAKNSRDLYRRYTRRFVAVVGDDPGRYDARVVRAFIRSQAEREPGSRGRVAINAMRLFLRFLAIDGRCSADLLAAVPRVPNWRLAALPPYLPSESVEKIVATANTASRLGLRDRAILLLLSRLGLRLGDVVSMRLGDIDWASGRLLVGGKMRRETWLPLPQDVGDALLEYLRRRDRALGTDHIFLRESFPIGPLGRTGIEHIVRQAIRRAQVASPSRGPHILRHSFASQMLRDGASLDVISRLLRHRDVQVTGIYAKVDVALLRDVVQPWPAEEVPSC